MQKLIESSRGLGLPPLSVNQETVNSHLFSRHDNRHGHQGYGVYLDYGLGRKKVNSLLDQHQSSDLISWRSSSTKSARNYRSTYLTSYHTAPNTAQLRAQCQMKSSALRKFHVITKDNFHRFPHNHSLPLNKDDYRPSTSTTDWLNRPHMTPLHVLAETQLPLVRNGHWKYSYKLR